MSPVAGGLKSANAASRDAPLNRSRASQGPKSTVSIVELATLDAYALWYSQFALYNSVKGMKVVELVKVSVGCCLVCVCEAWRRRGWLRWVEG